MKLLKEEEEKRNKSFLTVEFEFLQPKYHWLGTTNQDLQRYTRKKHQKLEQMNNHLENDETSYADREFC
jgi:hypothetical protein